jgi:hypothetical protein
MLHLQDCPPLLHPTHTQHAQALPHPHTHNMLLCAQMCAGLRRPGTEQAQHGARAHSSLHQRTSVRLVRWGGEGGVRLVRWGGEGGSSPLHPTTQSWSAVVRAPGAAQQPIQRRHGVTHHHFDPPPSPRAAPGTRHPIVHTSVGSSAMARRCS